MLYEFRAGVVNSAAFSPDGSEVVTASRDGVIRVWNMPDGKEAASFSAPGGEAYDASFSPDGARIVTTNADGAASVWTREGRLLFSLQEGNPGALTAAYSSDGTRILTTGSDNIGRIWDSATGKPLLTITSLASSIEFARFSPDGARVVTDSIDNYVVEVWDAASGRLLQTLENGGLGLGADFSPDGRQVASIGWDTMTVHEAASGTKRFAVMISETNRVFSSVAFARDGKRIITGDEYGIAQVWNATNGELIFRLNAFDPSSAFYRPGPARPLSRVTISPDGSRILTVGRGAAHIWGAN
jgi:WD40 repeat protein